MPGDFFQIIRERHEQFSAARSRRRFAHVLLGVSVVCLLGALDAGNSGEPIGELQFRVLGSISALSLPVALLLYWSAYNARRASRAKPEDLERAMEDL